jgi:hypothetical protein
MSTLRFRPTPSGIYQIGADGMDVGLDRPPLSHVRFGSIASFLACSRDVCLSPLSDRRADTPRGPKRARSRYWTVPPEGRGLRSVGTGAISAWVHRRSSGEQGYTYLTRFHLETGAPPSVPVKPVTVSSSPEIAMARFCVVPVQFGNVAASIWMLTDFAASSTEYVPRRVELP